VRLTCSNVPYSGKSSLHDLLGSQVPACPEPSRQFGGDDSTQHREAVRDRELHPKPGVVNADDWAGLGVHLQIRRVPLLSVTEEMRRRGRYRDWRLA
jgi:hypothetical protein